MSDQFGTTCGFGVCMFVVSLMLYVVWVSSVGGCEQLLVQSCVFLHPAIQRKEGN